MIRAAPAVPTCEACDAACAPFGFAMRYDGEDGKVRHATLWFCREHREVGEELWRASMQHYSPGRLKAMTTPPERPRQGVLL